MPPTGLRHVPEYWPTAREPEPTVAPKPAGPRPKPATPGAAVGPVWVGAKLTQMALLLLTAALILRTIVTGHAPFANHYEFALSFAWGMILAQVFFEWRYRMQTLALISLPLIHYEIGRARVGKECRSRWSPYH